MYRLEDYNYDLPDSFIALNPAEKRDESRLLHIRRKDGNKAHLAFKDITGLLTSSDVLVINNTKVVPGRLIGKKESGGKVEALILDYDPVKAAKASGANGYDAECLMKSSKPPKVGGKLFFGDAIAAEILAYDNGRATLRFTSDGEFDTRMSEYGKIPLPPYIKRSDVESDKITYQTVYASEKGAIAAPTAGLHFTEPLLKALAEKGVAIVKITLHVGYGTFIPIRTDDIRDHVMHSERFHISDEASAVINKAVSENKRIVAVGTTSVRTLEYASDEKGFVKAGSGNCDLYIYPGYRFKTVGAIITNFHLPKSSLMLLVSAFYNREGIFAAYHEAVTSGYRFFSYGDAMFME